MVELNLLQKVPLFGNLDKAQLESILKVSQIREFKKDSVLLRQGDKGDALYLVITGRVKAVLLAEDGREVILASMEPGEVVGEMALFDLDEVRSATVIATEDSTLLSLSGKQFLAALRENPYIAVNLIRTLTERLKETSTRVANLILLDTYSRVGTYLMAMAKKHGKRLADGSVLVTRPTQQEIAHTVGASRETVSRALNELEHQGLIRMIGKKVIISGAPH